MKKWPPSFFDASSPDPALWPPKEFVKPPKNQKPKKKELTMTQYRVCSKCGTHGHNKRTCPYSQKEIEELKQRRAVHRAAVHEAHVRKKSDQSKALVSLMERVVSSLDFNVEVEFYAEGLIFMQVDGEEYCGADAVHVLMGMMLQNKQDKSD